MELVLALDSEYVWMRNSLTGTTMQVHKDRVDEYLAFGHTKLETVEPIVFEKKEDKLSDAAEKLKKTVAKAKATRKKKV